MSSSAAPRSSLADSPDASLTPTALTHHQRQSIWLSLTQEGRGWPVKVIDGMIVLTIDGTLLKLEQEHMVPLRHIDGDAFLKLSPADPQSVCMPMAASSVASWLLHRYRVIVSQRPLVNSMPCPSSSSIHAQAVSSHPSLTAHTTASSVASDALAGTSSPPAPAIHNVYATAQYLPLAAVVSPAWESALRVMVEACAAENHSASRALASNSLPSGSHLVHGFGVRLWDGGARMETRVGDGGRNLLFKLPGRRSAHESLGKRPAASATDDGDEADDFEWIPIAIKPSKKPQDVALRVVEDRQLEFAVCLQGKPSTPSKWTAIRDLVEPWVVAFIVNASLTSKGGGGEVMLDPATVAAANEARAATKRKLEEEALEGHATAWQRAGQEQVRQRAIDAERARMAMEQEEAKSAERQSS